MSTAVPKGSTSQARSNILILCSAHSGDLFRIFPDGRAVEISTFTGRRTRLTEETRKPIGD